MFLLLCLHSLLALLSTSRASTLAMAALAVLVELVPDPQPLEAVEGLH
jgi:hypothetical protein